MRLPLSGLAPARRRLVVTVLAVLLVALVAVVGKVALGRHVGGASVDQARPGPVIVLPGYGGETEPLRPLLVALRSEGRDVVLFRPTDHEQGDLRTQARRLAALRQEDGETLRRGLRGRDRLLGRRRDRAGLRA